ncbi:MAG: hypothetical protein Q7R33_05800 [Nitrosarchaeum sp.]|nr:hypothetical protein [Nitrosarchaeum sp.]
MTQDERHELVRALGRMVAGLQVPYSIDRAMLGTAGPEWAAVWEKMNFAGWQDEESIAIALEVALLDN